MGEVSGTIKITHAMYELSKHASAYNIYVCTITQIYSYA